MTKQWLAHFSDINLALIAFMMFLVFFVVMIVWTFRSNAKGYYQNVSELPLKDGDKL